MSTNRNMPVVRLSKITYLFIYLFI